ncbi:DUF4124 domain-containing protein [Uliginosibacterium sp. H3]|uniref:DUF4124 domain-containing protein n=1 Tax=Uliginosibacterium silvisoli TaxID=3114758 RepID=A0ABU6K3V4_9RHOO|nr:DUF4124 domain-containing protein [Uliginosibacterium sp. H3]
MKRSLLLIALCSCALGAQAEVYKWIDADGKVQYGDAPPKNVKAKVVSGGVTVVPATVVPQPPPPKGEAGGAANAAKGDANPQANQASQTAQAPTPADQAVAARAEARQRAIDRCKANRGTDCEAEADAQLSGEGGVGYVQGGVIPGWSQPPIRPNRPVAPVTPPAHKPVPKPHEPALKEAKQAPPPGKQQSQSQSSAPAIKPML